MCAVQTAMSALGQKRTLVGLFDHFVGDGNHAQRSLARLARPSFFERFQGEAAKILVLAVRPSIDVRDDNLNFLCNRRPCGNAEVTVQSESSNRVYRTGANPPLKKYRLLILRGKRGTLSSHYSRYRGPALGQL